MRTFYYIWLLLSIISFQSCSNEAAHQNTSEPTAFADPPKWSQEAIWYQIFVERFRNGDPTNDPTAIDMVGAYPGFVPDNWKVTPWTQDWYKNDDYITTLKPTDTDPYGNPLKTFGQKSQLRRYGGDLQGVLDKLDYLQDLGITAIYFNPVNDAPSLHKFDARYWRHIDRNFGPAPEKDAAAMAAEDNDDRATWIFTEADSLFLKVIDACHDRGIRLILDYSFNHTGSTFWAWEDIVKQQADSPYKDWYWIDAFDDPKTPENEFAYKGWFGVPDLPEIRETAYHDPSKGVKAFEGNIVSDAAKSYIFNIARRWLDPNQDGNSEDGIDGFRLDVAAEVPLGFWRDFRQVVREVNPDAYLVGELWWETFPDTLLDPKPFLEGDVFDAPMNYRWYRSARHFFAAAPDKIPVSRFVDSLQSFQSNLRAASNYAMMNLVSSHDSPRVLTSLYNKNKYKLDARPEEDSTYKINRPDARTFETFKMLLAHQFTYQGAPHIWAGDEMGMWGATDPSCRKPLIWTDYSFEPETHHPLGLDRPTDPVEFDQDLFQYYKRLIDLRKSHPVLSHGDLRFVLIDDDRDLLAYSRADASAEILVLINAGETTQSVTLPTRFPSDYQDLLDGRKADRLSGQISMEIEARRVLILSSN